MRYQELLTEMMWADRYEGARQARNHPRAWIHFTDVPKLGVHPTKRHRDPPGIYFYPCRWLFTDEPSLSQFATERQYFYIVRLKKSANIINLGKITMAEVTAIATNNGWIDELQAVVADPGILKGQIREIPKRIMRKPGAVMYATMDYLANQKGRSWLGMLKGYHGLYDPGNGIISDDEVAQLVVFGRQWFDVIVWGENTDNLDRAFAGMLKRLAQQYHGEFAFRQKVPTADFVIDGKPIRMAIKLDRMAIELSYFHQGFWISDVNEYRNWDTGSFENEYQTLEGYLKSAAKTAETTGSTAYWNGQTIRGLFAKILGPYAYYRVRERIEDGRLQAFYSMQLVGMTGTYMWVTVDPNGSISAEIVVRIGDDDNDMKVAQTFGADSNIDQVSNALLDALAEKLIAFTQGRPNAVKFLNRFARFGNRFDHLLNGEV